MWNPVTPKCRILNTFVPFKHRKVSYLGPDLGPKTNWISDPDSNLWKNWTKCLIVCLCKIRILRRLIPRAPGSISTWVVSMQIWWVCCDLLEYLHLWPEALGRGLTNSAADSGILVGFGPDFFKTKAEIQGFYLRSNAPMLVNLASPVILQIQVLWQGPDLDLFKSMNFSGKSDPDSVNFNSDPHHN